MPHFVTTSRRPLAAGLSLSAAVAAVGLSTGIAGAEVISQQVNLHLYENSVQVDFDNANGSDFLLTHTTNPVLEPGLSGTGDKTDLNGELTLTKDETDQFLAILKDADDNYAETYVAGQFLGPGATLIDTTDPNYDPRLLDTNEEDANGTGGAFSVTAGEMPSDDPDDFGPVFVGFAFGDESNPNYGYLQFDNVYNDSSIAIVGEHDFGDATLTGWAIETTPGAFIEIAVIPEPTSAVLLAPAAAMLLRRRRTA